MPGPSKPGPKPRASKSGSAPHAPSSEAPATSGAPPEAAAAAGAATAPHPSIRSAPSPQRLQLILLLVGQDRVYLLSVGVLLLHHGVPLCRHQIQELSLGDLAVAKLIPHATYLETGTVVCLSVRFLGALEALHLLIRQVQLLPEPYEPVCRPHSHWLESPHHRPLASHASLAPRAGLTLEGNRE